MKMYKGLGHTQYCRIARSGKCKYQERDLVEPVFMSGASFILSVLEI